MSLFVSHDDISDVTYNGTMILGRIERIGYYVVYCFLSGENISANIENVKKFGIFVV